MKYSLVKATSTSGSVQNNEDTDDIKGDVSDSDFDNMYSNPDKYKNYQLKFKGQVLMNPERDGEDLYLQVFADPENYKKNIIVGYPDAKENIKRDDYISVKDIVKGVYTGENLIGGELHVPMVVANKVEVTDYIDVQSPTRKTIEIDETQEHNEIVAHVEKIE